MAQDASNSNGKNHPNSIKDALRALDDALQGQTENLKEFVTEDYRNIQSAMGNMSSRSTLGGASGLSGVSDRLKDFSSQAISQFSGMSSNLVSQETINEALARGREVYSEVDTRVRSNPWPVIGGIAVGTFALGFLLGRGGNSEIQR
jgi:ElaB/YqjD/DUF883 family membrane-anchored ribosome-binding protein